MTIRVGLIGAAGRFGKAIAANATLPFEIVPITRFTPWPRDCALFIDVSSAAALPEHLSKIDRPLIIGTTGHTDLSLIEKASRRIPIFYAPNFSLGIALMKRVAKQMSEQFPSDIDLVETHHTEKKDTPSGTALLLAKIIDKPVQIRSIRSGNTVGEHTLHFNTAEESLTLTHQAHTRDVFAKGALAAARFLLDKPPGLYGMDDL